VLILATLPLLLLLSFDVLYCVLNLSLHLIFKTVMRVDSVAPTIISTVRKKSCLRLLYIPYLLGDKAVLDDLLNAFLLPVVVRTHQATTRGVLMKKLEVHVRDTIGRDSILIVKR